jgi:hypothetical protein
VYPVSLTPERREQLLAATREAAVAFIEDAANYAAVPLPAGIGALGEMAASFQFNAQALNDDADLPFSYDPKNIDPVLVEMLATGHFLAISPDILTLETNVTKELRG